MMKNAAFLYLLGTMFNKGIAFLTIPLFTNILSPYDYGVVSTYSSWVIILSMLIGCAMHMSIRTAFIDFKYDIKNFLGSVIVFTFLILGLWIVSSICVYLLLGVNFSYLLVISCILQAGSVAIVEDLLMYYMMNLQYVKRTLLMVLPNLLSVLISIYILKNFCSNLESMYLGRILPQVFVYTITVLSVIFLAFKWRLLFNKRYVRYGLMISVPLIFHGISLNVLSQADRTMISWLADSTQTGIYSVGYNISMVSLVITSAFDGVWIPWFSKKLNEGKIEEINSKSKDYITLVTVVLSGFTMIIPEIITIMTPREYWECLEMIPLLILSNYFIFAYSMYVNIEHFDKKTIYVTKNSLIAASINLILNYIFIPLYGFTAAAFTTLISYCASFFMHYSYAKKLHRGLLPIDIFYKSFISIVAFSLLYYIFLESVFSRILVLCLYLPLMIKMNYKSIVEYFGRKRSKV